MPESKPERGRPITRRIEQHATAKEAARAVFAAAKPPDSSNEEGGQVAAGWQVSRIIPLISVDFPYKSQRCSIDK